MSNGCQHGEDCARNGEETACREPFKEQTNLIEGPGLNLMDATELCAFARYCDRGYSVWGYNRGSDDPEAKKLAIEETNNCSSGRLGAVDQKTKKPCARAS